MSINVTITSQAPGVTIGGGTSVSVAVSSPASPVAISLAAGGSTSTPDITQLEAGTGITISTAANQFQISSYSTSQVASFAPVKSVNGKTGTLTLQAVDVTAAAAVHTHGTADITGLSASIAAAALSASPVQSVAGRTGAVTLSTADVSGLSAVASSGSYTSLNSVPTSFAPSAHTHSTADIVSFTAAAAAAAPVQSVNGQTGAITISGGGSGPSLSDATPQPLGTASAGVSSEAARADHVHATLASFPWASLTGVPSTFNPATHTHSAADITSGLAAIATSGSANDLASGTVPAARLPVASDTTVGAIKIGSGLTITDGVVSASGGGGGGSYTLPTASSSVLGGVKVGSGLTITDGVLAATGGGGGSGLTWSSVPASATATGTAGQIAYDGSYLYVCTATNTWVRSSLATWTPFSPTSVTGLQLWLDASDSSTLYDATSGGSLAAPDATVKRWEDKSGNARHATESTNGPTRKTNQQNGLGSLLFNGSSTFLAGASTPSTGNKRTCFAVVKSLSTGTDFFQIGGGPVSGAAAFMLRQSQISAFSGNTSIGGDLYTNNLTIAGTTTNINQFHVACWRQAESTRAVRFWHNGVEKTVSGSVNSLAIGAGYFVGKARSDVDVWFWNGHVCEVVIYSEELTDADRAAVESYLTTKWGIA